ncbi:MAG TPA: hypothetical protein PLJ23_00020 [Gemmatimonadales bacterium]|jgi:two-component system sensor histidine kinase UhpB|nr:hypothetical protein [Gemmatimonadales bacterium]
MMLVVTFMLVGVILLATIIGSTVIQQSRLLRLRKSLSGRLIAAQDEERAALAREVHDDFVGRLDSIGRGLLALPGTDANDFGGEVHALSDELRSLSRRLHPALVEFHGLDAALRSLGEEMTSRTGIRVRVSVSGDPGALPKASQLGMFRIAQEALRNAIKHSKASNADIALVCTDDQAELVLTDDGMGFVQDRAVTATGLGLLSMAERARFLGGRLSIDSTLGAGTRVCALIPCIGRSK